jgi:hypothetical protein
VTLNCAATYVAGSPALTIATLSRVGSLLAFRAGRPLVFCGEPLRSRIIRA